MFDTIEEAIDVISEMAKNAENNYVETKKWTISENNSCMTMRVPVALIKRIHDMKQLIVENN